MAPKRLSKITALKDMIKASATHHKECNTTVQSKWAPSLKPNARCYFFMENVTGKKFNLLWNFHRLQRVEARTEPPEREINQTKKEGFTRKTFEILGLQVQTSPLQIQQKLLDQRKKGTIYTNSLSNKEQWTPNGWKRDQRMRQNNHHWIRMVMMW